MDKHLASNHSQDQVRESTNQELLDSDLSKVTGGIDHKEFVIVKLVDASTPKLFW